jgi:hypothetical protein
MKKLPTKQELEKYYNYDKNTGIVTRKIRMGNMAAETFVGNHQSKGYLETSFKNKRYLLHRLCFIMGGGKISDQEQIDHINHRRDDNRFENLRACNNMINNRNTTKRITNTSGRMGVWYRKDTRKWVAEIMVNYRKYILGSYETFEDAVLSRQDAEVKYGFHENHGVE